MIAAVQTTIALVEDEPEMRSLLADYLSHHGNRVHEFKDPLEFLMAMRSPRAFRPDFLITDMALPRMSGLSLLRTLAADRIELPTIMISVNLSPADEAEVRKLGAAAVLYKPFGLAELSAVIRTILSKQTERTAR